MIVSFGFSYLQTDDEYYLFESEVITIWQCNFIKKNVPVGAFELIQWRHNERDSVWNHQPSRVFTQPFSRAQIKENIKAPRHWP